MLLSIHIVAGGLAILLGTLALSVKKGGSLHRRAGLLFALTMLVMGTTAGLLGFSRSGRLTDGNILGGLMVAYFVGTAMIAVRRELRWARPFHFAALTIASVLAIVYFTNARAAFHSPGRSLNGVPFGALVFFATVMILAALGDIRVIRRGMLRGGQRLARHLWRMCFALFIAAGSFFSIRSRVARVLPEPFTTGTMRALPILLVFIVMFYWLWKVRSRSTPGVAGVRQDKVIAGR